MYNTTLKIKSPQPCWILSKRRKIRLENRSVNHEHRIQVKGRAKSASPNVSLEAISGAAFHEVKQYKIGPWVLTSPLNKDIFIYLFIYTKKDRSKIK